MITFYLKDPTRTESPIMAQATCSDGRIRKSTGKMIRTDWWEDGWVKMKGLKGEDRNNAEAIESYLRFIRAAVDDLALKKKVNNLPMSKVHIDTILSGKGATTNLGFLEQYKILIDKVNNGEILTKENDTYSPNTTKTWKNTLAILKKHFPEDICVDDITIHHVEEFVAKLNRNGEAKNYIGVQVKNWKQAMKLLHKTGVSNNLVYLLDEFKPRFEVVAKTYLTDAEVAKVLALDLSGSPYLDHIRDRWLVMYCTGLRVSDSRKLVLQYFDEDFITMMNEKTGKVVVIPFHAIMIAVLDKYNGTLPPNLHDVVINREIKIIGKMAGLIDKFTFAETRGGVTRQVTKQKWELLTCHTARRSVTTNMQKANVPFEIGGGMLGMSRKTWDHYNKATPMDKARVLKEHAFFKR
jgi:integrase